MDAASLVGVALTNVTASVPRPDDAGAVTVTAALLPLTVEYLIAVSSVYVTVNWYTAGSAGDVTVWPVPVADGTPGIRSTAPMSTPVACGRAIPRWSVKPAPPCAGSPTFRAGLPGFNG